VALVVSYYPTAQIAVSSATAAAVNSSWTVLSGAPFGRLVSSFAVVRSGAQVAFDLRVAGFAEGAGAFGQGVTVHFRPILTGLNVQSFSVFGNSAWKFPYTTTADQKVLAFQGVASLAPGNYSVELQGAILAAGASSSRFLINTNGWLTLLVSEGELRR
jgi:hypothetical protein